MAIVISGSNEYTSTLGIPGATWTLTAWLRTGTVGTAGAAVGVHQSDSVAAHVFIRDTGDLQLIDYGSYAFNGVNPLAASSDTWYRVAVVATSTTNVTFYRAAATDALGSGSVTDFSGPATPTTLYVGDHFYDEPWIGRIAAVKLWDAALTAVEVENELAQYIPRRTANLLHFHPFIQAEVTDYSGGSNSLTGGSGATTVDGPPIPWCTYLPLTVTPTASGASLSDTVTNSVGVTDNATDTWTLARAQSDAVGVTDTVTDAWTLSRTTTDAVGITDSVVGAVGPVRVVSDAVGITDATAQTRTSVRTQTDTVGLTDAAATARAVTRLVTDAVGLLDSQQVTRGSTHIDSVNLTDSVVVTRVKLVTVTDPLGLVDSAARATTQARVITDAVGVVDDASGAVSGPLTTQRVRIHGFEPTSQARGTEPVSRISGEEVGSL